MASFPTRHPDRMALEGIGGVALGIPLVVILAGLYIAAFTGILHLATELMR